MQIFLGQARGAGVSAAAAEEWTAAPRVVPAWCDALMNGVLRSIGSVAQAPATHARRPAPHPMDVRRDGPTVQREDPGTGGGQREIAGGAAATGGGMALDRGSCRGRGTYIFASALRSAATRPKEWRRPGGQPRVSASTGSLESRGTLGLTVVSFPNPLPAEPRHSSQPGAFTRARERVTTAVVAQPTPSSH